MIIKLSFLSCVIMLIVGLPGSGKAALITWANVKYLDPNICIGLYETKSCIHDIFDGTDGYNGMLIGVNEYLADYQLTVALHDDGGRWAFWNVVYVDHPGIIADDDNGAVPVPEPATMLLMGVGLLTIGAIGKHINKS